MAYRVAAPAVHFALASLRFTAVVCPDLRENSVDVARRLATADQLEFPARREPPGCRLQRFEVLAVDRHSLAIPVSASDDDDLLRVDGPRPMTVRRTGAIGSG
jgi:hypothetical protein